MSDPKYKNIGPPAIRVMEECAELIQAVAKAERFGYRSHNPSKQPFLSNIIAIQDEWRDLQSAFAELMEQYR